MSCKRVYRIGDFSRKVSDRHWEDPSREMWVFYLISLPLTVGMVLFTLRYYAAPHVPRYVLLTVGYTWLSSLSIIILVPADIWTVLYLLIIPFR